MSIIAAAEENQYLNLEEQSITYIGIWIMWVVGGSSPVVKAPIMFPSPQSIPISSNIWYTVDINLRPQAVFLSKPRCLTE